MEEFSGSSPGIIDDAQIAGNPFLRVSGLVLGAGGGIRRMKRGTSEGIPS
jgi:hypothetical protein